MRVFAQGSYRNRVNVTQDSDVDIGVLCSDTFFYDVESGVVLPAGNIEAATYDYAYKNDLLAARSAHVRSEMVTRGNKALKVSETSYHRIADAGRHAAARAEEKN